MKKKILCVVGILTFISGYSNNNDNDYENCEDYKSTFQGHAVPKDQMQKGYNHPARIDVRNSWDYYISASYIYWQPRQDGLELAREVYTPEVVGEEITHNTLIHMDFDYHSGFKVGMGANFERDDWSLDFEYTRLYTTDHKNKTLSRDLANLEMRYFEPFWNQPIGCCGFYAKGAKAR